MLVSMKSFQQFVTEAREIHDREGLGSGTGTTHRTQTGKIGSERKKSELTTQLKQHKGQKKRVKAVGGGKTVEVGGYKQRKDVGTQRSKSSREQQRKARAERLAAKSGGKSKKDLEKAATKLLTKKTTKAVSPNYKAQKASGYTANERRKLQRAGDRLLRDIAKKKEKPAAHYDPEVRKSK